MCDAKSALPEDGILVPQDGIGQREVEIALRQRPIAHELVPGHVERDTVGCFAGQSLSRAHSLGPFERAHIGSSGDGLTNIK